MQDLLNSNYRRSILRMLSESMGYSANDDVIKKTMALFGNDISTDNLKTHVYWLKEQGLVECEERGAYLVATLTSRGDDVLKGLAIVPGINRPRPGI